MEHVRQSYLSTQVSTVGQGDVVVLLFEKAILCLTQAKEKIIEKDFAQKGILISKAIDIINLLDASLNMEKGGTMAENLHNLYFFCNTQLLQANIKLDTEKLDTVIHTLSELNEAFAEAVKDPEAKAVAEEIGRKFENGGREQRTVTAAPSAGVGSKAANNAYSQVARSAGIEVANKQNANTPQEQDNTTQKPAQELSALSFATALLGNNKPNAGYTKTVAKPTPSKQNPQNTPLQANPLSANISNPLINNNVYTNNMLKVEEKVENKQEEQVAQNVPNKLVNPLLKNYMNTSSGV